MEKEIILTDDQYNNIEDVLYKIATINSIDNVEEVFVEMEKDACLVKFKTAAPQDAAQGQLGAAPAAPQGQQNNQPAASQGQQGYGITQGINNAWEGIKNWAGDKADSLRGQVLVMTDPKTGTPLYSYDEGKNWSSEQQTELLDSKQIDYMTGQPLQNEDNQSADENVTTTPATAYPGNPTYDRVNNKIVDYTSDSGRTINQVNYDNGQPSIFVYKDTQQQVPPEDMKNMNNTTTSKTDTSNAFTNNGDGTFTRPDGVKVDSTGNPIQ